MNSCRRAQSPLGVDLAMCSLSELHPAQRVKDAHRVPDLRNESPGLKPLAESCSPFERKARTMTSEY
jgi:hypothetical protein